MRIFLKIAAIILVGSLAMVSVVYAADNPGSKLGRGLTNIVASPLEYVIQTAELADTHDSLTAFFGGLANGTWFMLERIGVGLYEIVTFPIPLPSHYGPVLEDATPLPGFLKIIEGKE